MLSLNNADLQTAIYEVTPPPPPAIGRLIVLGRRLRRSRICCSRPVRDASKRQHLFSVPLVIEPLAPPSQAVHSDHLVISALPPFPVSRDTAVFACRSLLPSAPLVGEESSCGNPGLHLACQVVSQRM